MRIRAIIAGIVAALLIILGLGGCATSGSRGRYLEQIEPASITNLAAYLKGNSLEIRYPLRGEDAFAHAAWAPAESGATNYQYRYAVLTFRREKRRERKKIIHQGVHLAVRDAQQWRHLVHAVFAGLAPHRPGHGVLLLVQNLEVVVFRDAQGRLKVVKLADKPADVRVDHAFSGHVFSREAIRLMEARVNTLERGQSRYLFVTGEDPAFVLVDVRRHLIVFFSYPADPEAQPVEVPGWFTVRALNTLLIKSFVITALKNPFTLITRGLWHIGNSGETVLDSFPPNPTAPPPPLYHGKGMDLAAWEKHLDRIVSEPRYKGSIHFYINGDEFFPALIQSFENATNSIDVMVYIFGTDPYAVKIANILKQRSSCVRVRVLLDDLGTLFAGAVPSRSPMPFGYQRPGDIKTYLRTGSHVHVRASTNPWLTVDHRKCIIIDHRLAYLGGMNIGGKYRYQWHDMMEGLTGPIVGRLEKEYRKAWAHAGPLGDFAYAWVSLFGRSRRRAPDYDVPGAIDIRPLRTTTGKREIYRAQLAAIRRAKRYIYIEDAYFNDDTILRELIEARQRGVDVRVILPAENDIGIMQTSNLVMANEMIRNGIRVYIYPGMTHVKAAIYDGWACVGSANLDKLSLRVSQELDVAFSDPATVDRLKRRLFEADFKRSRELKKPVTLSWLDSLVKALADQL